MGIGCPDGGGARIPNNPFVVALASLVVRPIFDHLALQYAELGLDSVFIINKRLDERRIVLVG